MKNTRFRTYSQLSLLTLTASVCVFASVLSTTQSNEAAVIQVGANRRASRAASSVLYVEPHLSAHPKDAMRLLAATGTVRRDDGTPGLATLASRDGGSTWVEQELTGFELPASNPNAIDPWTALGADDHAFISAIIGSGNVSGGMRLYVYISEDGGQTWRRPVIAPGTSYDHPSIAVDTTSGPHAGRVYVLGSQGLRTRRGTPSALGALLRSTDHGATFTGPTYLSRDTFNNQVGNVVISPDGTVIAAHFEMQLHGKVLEHSRLWVTTSRDGGATLERTHLVRSSHGTRWPALAIDESSGPHRRRLYVTWLGPDEDEHIYLMASDDDGETWSEAVRVSAVPARGGPGTRNPRVAVNSKGVVLVSWPDSSAIASTSCFHLMASASVDGGRVFTIPVTVSSEPSCGAAPGNAVKIKDYNQTVGERWASGGDYHGLTASADGAFHLMWADSRSGSFELWTAKANVSGKR